MEAAAVRDLADASVYEGIFCSTMIKANLTFHSVA